MSDKFLELFIEKTFYNELFNKLKSYIYLHRDEIKVRSYTLSSISYKALDDFSIKSVLTRNMVGDAIESHLLIIATLEIKGHSKYGHETDSAEKWLDVTVSYQLNNGLHHFSVRNITEYDATNKEMKQTPDFTLEFVPYRDMEQVAEGIVRKYYPEALNTPMALPIDEYLSNIGLTKIEGRLTSDSSIFGEMIFKDTTITLYDEDTPKELAASKGTILVDPEVICLRNQGSYHNTIVHESVHWLLHRLHNEYRMLQDKSHKRSSSRVEINHRSSEKWTAYDFMEWQANNIAPRILMPRRTMKQMVQEFFVKHSLEFEQEKKALMFEQIIDDLSEFFQVSRLAVKIRLLQLGYKEFEGTYNYVGNEYIRSYTFEVGALDRGQTFTISFKNACMLNAINPRFKELMNTERFVYVDSHFCLNDEKYVEMIDLGIYQMTDYAYEHMDECCLTFDVRYQTDGTLSYKDFNDYIMYRGSNPERKIKVDFSECLINQEILGNVPEYTAEVYKKVAEVMENLPGNFCKTMVYHRKRRDFT